MSDREIVFLMYHELGIPGRPLCRSEHGYSRYAVEESDFRSQIRWLQQSGWRGMSVGQALASQLPSKDFGPAIVFTFDDGCESDLLSAAPTLKEGGFDATFYVTVAYLGQRGYMNSNQLRELSSLGFEIGCHSMTHAYLTDLDGRGLRREMWDSKAQLEQILGKPVEHFSCPGGRCNARVVQAARDAGYVSLANSQVRANRLTENAFSLGRIAVQRRISVPTFQKICRAEDLWKLQARETLINTAKRMLGNSLYDRGRELLLR